MFKDSVLILENKIIEDTENIRYFLEGRKYISMRNLIQEKVFTATEIIQLITGIIDILITVENSNKILGSLNLDNIFIDENNYWKIGYLTKNRLLDRYDSLSKYEVGEISAPEILNRYYEDIDTSTDVYLIGKILIKLINNNRLIDEGYHKEQLISYNYEALDIDLPVELHHFIANTISLSKYKRYNSVSKCKEVFKKIIERDGIRRSLTTDIKISKIECSIKTNVGIGKLNKLKEEGRDLSKCNEDSSIVSTCGENRTFFMVADGISNCEYGSGYEASNIVKKVCAKLWKKYGNDINSRDDVEEFINKIINISNILILKSVSKDSEILSVSDTNNIKDVMGTTFVGGVILDNKLFYFSVGDSRVYLFTDDKDSSLLTVDDNKGIEAIFSGLSWQEYKKLDGKSHLTRFVGGIKIVEDKIFTNDISVRVKEIGLLPGDILVTCTDGLTDMLKENIIGESIWDPDNIIGKILSENKDLELFQKNELLINLANENGGKDNITSILIKCY